MSRRDWIDDSDERQSAFDNETDRLEAEDRKLSVEEVVQMIKDGKISLEEYRKTQARRLERMDLWISFGTNGLSMIKTEERLIDFGNKVLSHFA